MNDRNINLILIGFALSGPVFAADALPTFTPIAVQGSPGSVINAPNPSLAWTFADTGLNASFIQTGTSWTLVAQNTTNSANFYAPGGGQGYAIQDLSFTLSAQFSLTGVFESGSLNITGYVASPIVEGILAPGSSGLSGPVNLLSASLTEFGYSAAQSTIGFETNFQPSWANQQTFSTGSTGEQIYLYSLNANGGLDGNGVLSGLINEFATQNFTRTPLGNLSSVAPVPLPASFILFGSALTALTRLVRRQG